MPVPEYAAPYNNLGAFLQTRGEWNQALEYFQAALRLRSNYPDAHKNLALLYLTLGDYERGWREYEWRWQCKDFDPLPLHQPRWDGSALEGRTILLFGEQGLGDVLHFVRYVPLVARRGGRIWLYCAAAPLTSWPAARASPEPFPRVLPFHRLTSRPRS